MGVRTGVWPVAALLTILTLLGLPNVPAAAHDKDDVPRGCTIGFWKNHTERWPRPYIAEQPLSEVFGGSTSHGLGSATLLDALRFRGGPGTLGGARILLRQAVAALLNEAQFVGAYQGAESIGALQSAVNTALGGSRSAMLSLADRLEEANDQNCSFLPVNGGK